MLLLFALFADTGRGTTGHGVYDGLADALLGQGVRPFDHFKPPPDISFNNFYRSTFATAHKVLARFLARHAGNGGWILELGSFVGNSATVLARAAVKSGVDAPVVCMDTWLGDVGMWVHHRLRSGRMGEPRLFEQFMANIVGFNATDRVIPVRVSSQVGLKFVRKLVADGTISRPRVIFLDTAHEYPETVLEMREAFEVLAPGGILTGDDYDRFWPGVQQSVN
eukprot:2637145-Prymnesium_polylepis.1